MKKKNGAGSNLAEMSPNYNEVRFLFFRVCVCITFSFLPALNHHQSHQCAINAIKFKRPKKPAPLHPAPAQGGTRGHPKSVPPAQPVLQHPKLAEDLVPRVHSGVSAGNGGPPRQKYRMMKEV